MGSVAEDVLASTQAALKEHRRLSAILLRRLGGSIQIGRDEYEGEAGDVRHEIPAPQKSGGPCHLFTYVGGAR